MLNLVITKLLEWFLDLRYWGLFISAMGIFPTEILIAILASMEENSIWTIALVTSLGEVVGAYPLFFLGRIFTGKNIYQWLDGKGRFLGIDSKKFERSKKKVYKKSYYYVCLSRFVPWLRVAVSLAAGFLRLKILPFSLSVFIGVYLYSLAIAYLGKIAGGDLDTIKRYIKIGDKWLIALVLGYIVVTFGWKKRKAIKKLFSKILKTS